MKNTNQCKDLQSVIFLRGNEHPPNSALCTTSTMAGPCIITPNTLQETKYMTHNPSPSKELMIPFTDHRGRQKRRTTSTIRMSSFQPTKQLQDCVSKLTTHWFVWSIIFYAKRCHSTLANIQPTRWYQDCVSKLTTHHRVQSTKRQPSSRA